VQERAPGRRRPQELVRVVVWDVVAVRSPASRKAARSVEEGLGLAPWPLGRCRSEEAVHLVRSIVPTLRLGSKIPQGK
jgi:hypothetical protein